MGARGAVLTSFGMTGALNAVWGTTLPATDARLDLGAGRVGVLLTCLAIGALAAMPAAGWLADRWTGRRLLRFALPTASLAVVALATVSSANLLFAAAAALGVLFGALNVALNVQAVAVERRLGRPVMSRMHGTWTLGAVLGGAAVSLGLRSGVNAQALMAASGIALTLASLSVGRHLPGSAPASRRFGYRHQVVRAVPALATHRPAVVLALGLIGAAAFVTEGAATDWAGVYATRVLGAAPSDASMTYTGFFIAMAAVRFIGDALQIRLGVVTTVRLTCGAAVVGYSLVLLAPMLATALGYPAIHIAMIGWALAGAGIALVWPIITSALGAASGPGRRLAAATTVSYGGGLIGPVLIGLVAEGTTLPIALFIPATLTLLLAVVAPIALVAATRPEAGRVIDVRRNPYPEPVAGAH
jgi:MFS family permease